METVARYSFNHEHLAFPNISPELFETLTGDERTILAALTQTYLEHVAQRQQRPPVSID